MVWFKAIVSLLFIAIKFSGLMAEPNFQSEILFSCISDDDAEELTTFQLKYDPDMSINKYKFHEGELDKLKELFGSRDSVIFFFLGHEDKLYSYHGKSFMVAKSLMYQTDAAVCTVSYAFLTGHDLYKYFQYFGTLEHRLPKVVDMVSTMISNIVDSKHFNIKLSTVYLTGFCLGGHIAGQVGHALKEIYNGQMVPAVWAFDPPKIGFKYPEKEGKPRRVQKGDAKFVAVFHTSKLGVTKCLADVDILVNGGESQPGCQFEANNMVCSHFAGFILRELIITNPSSLTTNRDGLPTVNRSDNDIIAIDFINPPYGKSGIYHMNTDMVFGTKKKGFFERLFQKDE
ncbi:uncharacterized protein LOC116344132 [Contarinia nasturtii]|uniref:uncharacterized protein LOC116344132 n=1 Tax=Contarinia nasturtii TaxID=265458 RepID=UPI0012D47277|nr:uncharacterized protein LOC116344132 [Contarinia nasturtii]